MEYLWNMSVLLSDSHMLCGALGALGVYCGLDSKVMRNTLHSETYDASTSNCCRLVLHE